MRRSVLAVVLVTLGGLACQPDQAASPTPDPSIVQAMSGPEEELFGNRFAAGVRTNAGEVLLTPYDAATSARLLAAGHPSGGGFSGFMALQTARPWGFGWFEPVATDGGCRGDIAPGETFPTTAELNQALVDGYLNINGRTRTVNYNSPSYGHEMHPENTGALERHCIRPGKYTLDLEVQSLVIDYLQAEANSAGSLIVIQHPSAPLGFQQEPIEAASYQIKNAYIDFVVNVETSPVLTHTESPVLEVQNAGSDRLAGTFTDAASASGSGMDWFRFSVAASTSSWSYEGRGKWLARLFYDYGVDPSIRTEYYDVQSNTGMIRTHQFGGHVSGSRCVIVGFELKRPDEQPAPVADVTRQVGVGTSCPTGADLTPMPISFSPGSVSPGGVTTVKFREHNVGTASAAASWTGRIYLSADATCCSGDIQADSYTEASAIGAGGYKDVTRAVTVPVGTAPGSYYVFANLDATGAVAEGDETNNSKAQVGLLTVTPPPAPDLTPSPVTFTPASVAVGGTVTVTVRQLNQGNAVVPSGWQGKIYLSADNTCCTGDVQLDLYTETSSIGAGGFIDKVRPVTIPPGTTLGTYYIFGSLDVGGAVAESNEGNNTQAAATTLSVTGTPPIACATFEKATTWKMADQVFNAGCSSTGANIQYRWQTDAGGGWTAYSSGTTYEFMGHASSGTHQVTVEVKNTTTGATATQSYNITVQNFQLTISGPTEITVKQNYTYTASTSSTWYERFVPSTEWGGGIGPQTVWTRTWSGGCYDVDVRADATAGGSVLKRGRILVSVMIGTGCGGGMP